MQVTTTHHAAPRRVAKTPKHVLVAEDDSELRRLLVRELVRDGHDVSSLADGRQLLDCLRAIAFEGGFGLMPDLIVSDVRMPSWSGTEALDQIRRVGWQVPVILISAFADEELHRYGESRGATVLAKPFDLDGFRATVLEKLAIAA